MTAKFIISELMSVANREEAEFLQQFFKCGKGQYADGDKMLGIKVPVTRNIVKHCTYLPLSEIQILLNNEWHEVRLAGLLLLVKQFKITQETGCKEIFDFYLKNTRCANNWDLVDITCRDIIGVYLLDKTDRSVLYRLAKSNNLWEQRISIVSTWTFIKHYQYIDTLKLAKIFLNHKHDLIHKATGWMLRETGKKNKNILLEFLEEHKNTMPRTMLRYAIEKFSCGERQYFLKK